ncbi:MAG: glutathione S-transferase family protein [Alphaproteobacteria bacterium]|nr:glutathione S-transferase family protein [Alphaproteobacteria bacterium]
MYRLYARKGAGSMAVEALLAECAAPYQVTELDRDSDNRFPESFQRINPRSEVPTLILPDDSVMTESAAIMIYLADLHPAAGLAPAVTSPVRGRYLRWMVYMATTLYMSDLRLYYPHRYTTDPAGVPGIKAFAESGMAREFAILADAVGEGPYLLGGQFSAVDLYAAMLVSWDPDMIGMLARHPTLRRLYDNVVSRPAVAAVWRRNGL